MSRRTYRQAGLLLRLLGCLLLPGCGGNLGPLTNARQVTLNGAQVSATDTSSATGTASVVVASDRQSITVITRTTGLSNITGAHIHAGLTGTSGLIRSDSPIIFSLFESGAESSNGQITSTLSSPNLTAQSSVGISTFDDAVNAILAGRAYIDFHTTAYPDGEIRGQIMPASFSALLSGENEVPPSNAAGTGSATITIDPATCTLHVTITATSLAGSTVSQANIYVGAKDATGPIIFPIFDITKQPFSGAFSRTLTATDLVVQAKAGVSTCYDAVNAIIAGNAYVNLLTLERPLGALRGQLAPTVNQ